ncbi:hypothetical protein [Streptomyces barringtoniae]|uniref:hypothetical protein n=1 Tax=Streptomyces barringtoniae TaxID=2892029 RepID=UPI001E429FC0|nr:hypothetical protein [Streptomyces barringtoniae]MCC5476317.1 hypothetical protein [Streptomyces barringtoniae]
MTDIADQTVWRSGAEERESGVAAASVATASADIDATADRGPLPPRVEAVPEEKAAQARRRRFLAALGEFRRSRVLVPVGTLPGPDAEEVILDMGP